MNRLPTLPSGGFKFITMLMEILVTGGCGFIGSHLVDRLIADGHRVTVLDNLATGLRTNLHPHAAFVEGSVMDAALVQSLINQTQAVFHLAAVASVDAYRDPASNAHATNHGGTATVFKAANTLGTVPVIYASSAAVYGDNPALPLGEQQTPAPLSAYGRDKCANEHLAAQSWQQYRTASAGLRFFNVYGPRQAAGSAYSGVISTFMAGARAQQPLTFFGDGTQTRDFIYIADIVALLLAALAHLQTSPQAAIFNGCTGAQTSLKQLAETIGLTLGTTVTTREAPARAGDIRHSCGDPAHARAALGFTATTALAAGLAQLRDADA